MKSLAPFQPSFPYHIFRDKFKCLFDRENEYEEDEDEPFISLNSFSYFQENRYRYAIEFPNIMRTSLFFSCYAFLENHLLTVCKEVRRKKRIELDINEIKHNGIEKAQVYLKKVAGLNFPDQSAEWNHIRKCNRIRNILIHNSGFIDSDNNKLKKDIDSITGVRIDSILLEEKIILEESFCYEFINNMRKFLGEISKEYHVLFGIYGRLK